MAAIILNDIIIIKAAFMNSFLNFSVIELWSIKKHLILKKCETYAP